MLGIEKRCPKSSGARKKATEKEIEDRFKTLAKSAHSDLGGSDEKLEELVAARDFLRDERVSALATISSGKQVAVPQSAELITLERERAAEKRATEKSERVTQRLVRAEVTRLDNSKRKANLAAWLGGGAAAVIVVLRSVGSYEFGEGSDLLLAVIVGTFCIFAAGCAAVGFLIRGRIATVEQAIEDASEAMTDRATFLDLFYEVASAGEDPEQIRWQAEELQDAIQSWSHQEAEWDTWLLLNKGRTREKNLLKRLSLRIRWSLRSLGGQLDPNPRLADLGLVIGREAFYRLFLAKGEETKLLRARERFEDGRLRVSYEMEIEAHGSVA